MRAASGLILLALLAASAPALAGGVGEDEHPYERCALCHGLFGDSARDKFPKLAGQPEAYLMAQIQAFLAGTRTNDGGQMAGVVTELDPAQFPVVVNWFASQVPPKPAAPVADQTGAEIFAAAQCGACHDGGPKAVPTPLLTAQHPAYLAKQMRDFKSGARAMTDLQKTTSMAGLSDAELEPLAAWLGAQPRVPHE